MKTIKKIFNHIFSSDVFISGTISDASFIESMLRDEIVRGFDWIPSDKRASLAAAQKQGIDIYTMLGASALTAKANELTQDSNLGLDVLCAISMVFIRDVGDAISNELL